MTITQTVDIPASHKLTIDVPREIPEGRAVLAFTPAPVDNAVEDEDTTEYLLRSPANREHLLNAIESVKEGKNLITFESAEAAHKCAEEWAAKQ